MRAMLTAAIALCLAGPLRAQALNGQDSSLAGMRTVVLRVSTNLRDSLQLREAIALELRKAGLRIVADVGADGVIDVLMPSGGCDGTLRWIVSQRTRLVRNGAGVQALTWWYEYPKRGCAGMFAEASRTAADAFLNAWLGANGR